MRNFEEKYGQSFTDFVDAYDPDAKSSKFDDFVEWEFVLRGRDYWKDRLNEIRNYLDGD